MKRPCALTNVAQRLSLGMCGFVFSALSGQADPSNKNPIGTFGTPGLIDMPIAAPNPDAQLTFATSQFGATTRNTISFQITPRLSGSYRYSILRNLSGPGNDLFDRSFDLQYHLVDEGPTRPAIAIGLRDMLGTGVYASEYIVATKNIGPGLSVTGGLGWGRLGSRGGFTNPLSVFGGQLKNRPSITTTTGGTFNSDVWFRGDAAAFGGLNWQMNDRLSLSAEISSDAYSREVASGIASQNSPLNLGLTYRVFPGIDLSAFYMHGSELGFQLTMGANPKKPPHGATPRPAPPPIRVRHTRMDTGSAAPATSHSSLLHTTLKADLLAQGIRLREIALGQEAVEIRVQNVENRSFAQAIGRSARVLTSAMPSSIENFTIIPVEKGMALGKVSLRRSDLEELEHAPDAAWQSWTRATTADPLAFEGAMHGLNQSPKFSWAVEPYIDTELFDPDNPVRADLGLRAMASFSLGPDLIVSGAVRKKIAGNLGTSSRVSDSILPHVRSDNAIYNRNGDPALEYLTVEKFFRPAESIYGRMSAGYLEKMYGGFSTELLWKPIDRDFGIGLELNYARQRDFGQGFGFQSYGITTGHLSTYFEFGSGFHAQVDVGRYLAGDWGTTLSLDREFSNGWKIGAFATLTDVSFSDFGEGSFDKGIRITIPMDWLTGRPTRRTSVTTIRPLLRDGGARLNVRNRLYDIVRPAHDKSLRKEWGLFWR